MQRTSLEDLVLQGNLEELKAIVSQPGFNWCSPENRMGELGCTALISKHFEILKWLVNETDYYDASVGAGQGYHLIFECVSRGHLDILKWLVNEKLFSFEGHVETAIAYGQIEVFQWLIHKKNCSMIVSTYNETIELDEEEEKSTHAVLLAAHYGQLEMLQWMVEKKQCNLYVIAKKYGEDPFLIAVQLGDLAMLKWLAEKYWDLISFNAASSSALTTNPVFLAVKHKHLHILQWFAEIGRLNRQTLYHADVLTFLLIDDEPSLIFNNSSLPLEAGEGAEVTTGIPVENEIITWLTHEETNYHLNLHLPAYSENLLHLLKIKSIKMLVALLPFLLKQFMAANQLQDFFNMLTERAMTRQQDKFEIVKSIIDLLQAPNLNKELFTHCMVFLIMNDPDSFERLWDDAAGFIQVSMESTDQVTSAMNTNSLVNWLIREDSDSHVPTKSHLTLLEGLTKILNTTTFTNLFPYFFKKIIAADLTGWLYMTLEILYKSQTEEKVKQAILDLFNLALRQTFTQPTLFPEIASMMLTLNTESFMAALDEYCQQVIQNKESAEQCFSMLKCLESLNVDRDCKIQIKIRLVEILMHGIDWESHDKENPMNHPNLQKLADLGGQYTPESISTAIHAFNLLCDIGEHENEFVSRFKQQLHARLSFAKLGTECSEATWHPLVLQYYQVYLLYKSNAVPVVHLTGLLEATHHSVSAGLDRLATATLQTQSIFTRKRDHSGNNSDEEENSHLSKKRRVDNNDRDSSFSQ